MSQLTPEQKQLLAQSKKDKWQINILYDKFTKFAKDYGESTPWFEEAWPLVKLAWEKIQFIKYPILPEREKKMFNRFSWQINEYLQEQSLLAEEMYFEQVQLLEPFPQPDQVKRKKRKTKSQEVI